MAAEWQHLPKRTQSVVFDNVTGCTGYVSCNSLIQTEGSQRRREGGGHIFLKLPLTSRCYGLFLWRQANPFRTVTALKMTTVVAPEDFFPLRWTHCTYSVCLSTSWLVQLPIYVPIFSQQMIWRPESEKGSPCHASSFLTDTHTPHLCHPPQLVIIVPKQTCLLSKHTLLRW